MIPCIVTDRLRLRPFAPSDAPAVQRLAGDREVAATASAIPHPYEDGMAEQWIATHEKQFAAGEAVVLAVTEADGERMLGATGLVINREHEHAELGYWIGRSFWSCGYATEAAEAVIEFGFATMGLHRIYAHHFAENTASGRVLQKAGMQREGVLREHLVRWGSYKDAVHYGILAGEWRQQRERHAR